MRLKLPRKHVIYVALALAWCSPVGQAQSKAAQARTPESPDRPSFASLAEAPRFAPDRVIVRFRSQKVALEKGPALHARVGGTVRARYLTLPALDVVQLPPGVTVGQALSAYRRDRDVLYAEPDYRVELHDTTPNDPFLALTWAMKNTGANGGVAGADIKATQAWDISTGSSEVVIAVIDTGVNYTHPDLAPNMYRNEVECAPNTEDDDGNGWVDDCHGINLTGDSSEGDPFDWIGHGGHVAGTIGAAGNNGEGVAGVAWQVKMLACKFIGWTGGFTSDAITCIDYLAQRKDQGVNLVATNNSWGSPFYSQALKDAIQTHLDRGILFVASAGNGGLDGLSDDNDVHEAYPAGYDLPNIIAVAASDRADRLASFSNHGRRSVHLAAPGVGILSTIGFDRYIQFNGTSMASPHVTGAIALLKAHDPALDWRQLRNLVVSSGDLTDGAASTISGRRLNVQSALTCADREVHTRLQPRTDLVTTDLRSAVRFRVLSIDCGNPAGGTQSVTVEPGGHLVELRDDGTGADQAAADGVFSGEWLPPALGRFTATFADGDTLTIAVLRPYRAEAVAFANRGFTGTNLNLDYWETRAIDSPFPVRFGSQTFHRLYVSPHGLVSFDRHYDLYFGPPLPQPGVGSIVAPLWDVYLATYPTEQNVFWGVLGNTPNRELVVEWRNVPGFDLAPRTFQVVFFESSDDVLFSYSLLPSAFASVGIQVGPSEATQYSFFDNKVTANSTVRWTLADADLGLSVLNTSLTAFPGQVKSFQGKVTSLFGQQGAVQVQCSGASQPLSCAATTVTPSREGTSYALPVSDTVPGERAFEVKAESLTEGVSRAVPVTLRVVDLGVSAPSPPALTVPNGGSATVSFVLTSLGGFAGGVTLSCEDLPAGAGCAFLPASTINLAAGAAVNASVSITVAPQTALATHEVKLVALPDGAPLAKKQNLSLAVGSNPTFVLRAASALLQGERATPATIGLEVASQDGYAGTVALSCSVAPAGPACSLSSSAVAAFPSLLTLTLTPGSAPATTYTVTVQGTDGGGTRSVQVQYHLVDYAISGPATTLTYWGQISSVMYQVTANNGYKGSLEIGCDSSALGSLCFASPSSVSFAHVNSATVFIFFAVATPNPGGDFPVRLRTRDLAGPLVRETLLTVTVRGVTLTRGARREHTITVGETSPPFDLVVTPVNGYDLPSTITDWGCNPHPGTCSFTPVEVTPSGNPVAIEMRITLPPLEYGSNGGSFGTLTNLEAVTPNFGTMRFFADGELTLHVRDFHLQATPTQPPLLPGLETVVKVQNKQFHGLNAAVQLSCPSQLPTGVSCRIEPASLGPGETANVILAAAADTPTGNRQIDITGVATVEGRQIVHKVALVLFVNDVRTWLEPEEVSVPDNGEARFTLWVEATQAILEDIGNFEVSCLVAVPGVTCEHPPWVTPPSGAGVVLRPTPGVTPTGTHPFTIRLSYWGRTEEVTGRLVIQGRDSIVVTAPNGWELWRHGLLHHITWQYTGSPGAAVKVELLKNGVFDRLLGDNVPIGADGKGYLSWQQPIGFPFSPRYRVRVTSKSDPAMTDTSDENVWMGSGVEFTFPTGGEDYHLNQFMRFGYTWAGVGSIRVELHRSGQFVEVLEEETAGYFFSRGYNWGGAYFIPPFLPPGSNYSLKIFPSADPARFHTTGPVTIHDTKVMVQSPAVGEVWRPGTQQTIQWNWTGKPGIDVRIDLLIPSLGHSARVIATTTPIGNGGSGSYTWTVPSDLPPASHYAVQVSSYGDISFGSASGLIAVGDFRRLTVIASNGYVRSLPQGIDCGSLCVSNFANGSAVTLTAQPLPGYSFAGWSGACSGTGDCALTMSNDRTVTANFQPVGPPDFGVSANPGSVTIGAGATAQYTIALTATSSFNGTATLSCSGLPSGAACIFQPASVAVSQTTASSTLSLTTTPRTAAHLRQLQLFATLMPFVAILGLAMRRRRVAAVRTSLMLLALTAAIAACGGGGGGGSTGGGNPPSQLGTPAGSFSVTINAQSGSVRKTTTVMLIVQ